MSKKILSLKLLIKIIRNNKIETTLVSVVLCFFIILALTQIGMISSKIRPYLSSIDTFEGQQINEIDTLIENGTITLELVDMSKEKDIKVLVNGIEVASFNTKTVKLDVKDNSVVEIDGSRLKSSAKVKIIEISENIANNILNDEVTVMSNIKVLSRIKLK